MQKVNKILSYLPTHMKKDAASNNYKFINSFNTDFTEVSAEISNLKKSIQLETATGNNLNDIGELFMLNRRENESDSNYRARIKAFWPGYSGGGTEGSIKQAINRMVGLDPSQITITDYMPKTKLTANINESVTTLPVIDTSRFRDEGTVIINDEIITYTGKTATSFTGCSRGALNSTETTHRRNNNIFDYNGTALKFKVQAIIPDFSVDIATIQDVLVNSKAAGTYIVFNLNAPLTDNYNSYADNITISITDAYWIPDWTTPDSVSAPL